MRWVTTGQAWNDWCARATKAEAELQRMTTCGGCADAEARRAKAEVELSKVRTETESWRERAINAKHMQELRNQLEARRQLLQQATADLAAARNEIGNLQRSRDSADEQVRIMSEALAASNAENGKLVAQVERLEFEVALLTKHATPIPELPAGVVEEGGSLYEDRDGELVHVAADNFLTRNAWGRRLVAERNEAREKVVALQRRIEAMTRSMGPVACDPTPGPSDGAVMMPGEQRTFATSSLPASATILDTPPPNGHSRDGSRSPYKRD